MTAKHGKRQKRRKAMDPWQDREAAVDKALEARENGLSLRKAAAAAGIHVATLCRWQNASPILAESLRLAERDARLLRIARMPERKPSVPWRKDCPRCSRTVTVRHAGGWPGIPFYCCTGWLTGECSFASWRPRALEDCSRCHAPRFWSCSRKSIVCEGCLLRVFLDQEAA